jgi:hypothetical protein
MVNIKRIELQDGYLSEEKENGYLRAIMFEEVIKHLVNYENKKAVVELQVMKRKY